MDADLASGRVPVARQRLRGWSPPTRTNRHPGAAGRGLRPVRGPSGGGRWMYLEEDRRP
ncbi:DUF6584 family protein [Streptomyces sp. CBG30]|uniref:DUF6584 family protein n=1 Tax=Streptomyces sp. CBG30 TaxID=2838869 RepID=UPI0035B1AF77